MTVYIAYLSALRCLKTILRMKKHLTLLVCSLVAALAFMTPKQATAQTEAYYIYSNAYGGFEPWYTTVNTTAMNEVFGVGEWIQEYFETCDPAIVFNDNTNFVFLEGSDGFADELETFLTANMATIETWVNNGGRLLLNAAPNEGDGMDFGFGGVTLTYWGGSSNVHAEDPSHPIFSGPYTPTGLSWTGSSFSHASVSGPDITPLIVDDFAASTVALAEGRYGVDGIVMFGGMTTVNFHYPTYEATNLFWNIIEYLAFFVFADHDIAALNMVTPTSGCGLGVSNVEVTFKNYGTNDEVNIPVSYQLDGGAVVNDIIPGPIPAGASYVHTFSIPGDVSDVGTHNFHITCALAIDENPLNDELDVAIENIPVVASFPYLQDFEAGAAGWITGGDVSSWELGTPAGPVINTAPPATPGSLNSWTTSLTGYYNDNEKSYVVSPCFDFSDLVFPYLEFDYMKDIGTFSDGAKVQYSTDAGASWSDLGNVGTGENWYNSFYCYGMWPTFYITDYRGWDGTAAGWVTAYQDLSFLAGESSVKLRIVFASDFWSNFYDGFAFDNFKISDLFPNDVGVSAIEEPESGPSLTAAETVSVEITNYGTLSQTGFPVSYKMGAGPVHTETFTGTVAPGLTAIHTFATTENLSVLGDYTFTAWTGLATDEDLTNDTIVEVVSNLEPIGGTNAYYIYSNTTGGEPWFTTSNTAAMDAVFGFGEWTQGYYETVVAADVFSTSTCFVFLEGSDGHAIELENFLVANLPIIENWVAAGGHLFLNAAPNEGDDIEFGFDGTVLHNFWYSSNVTASDPGHPVWAGPFTPTATSMSGFSYGHASVSGDDWDPILYDTFTPDRIICAEKSWGAGTVIFGGMTSVDFHSPLTEAANFRKNIISYLAACTISDYDVGAKNIIAPVTGCGLTAVESVTIEVKNYGFLPQTDVPVYYQLDAEPIVAEIVPGTIGVGETVEYTFATTIDLSGFDTYSLATWTGLVLDTIVTNDTTIESITNVPIISTYPYYEDWEGGDEEGWTTYGVNNTWELGFLDGPVINEAPIATPTSQNSWATSLVDVYSDNEISYLESPCFDMSSLVIPYLEVDLWWYTEDFWDGMILQYSTDGGGTWSTLGDIGTGENWYTGTCYSHSYLNAWEGYGPGWVTSHHDVTFLAGETDVKFRFKFAADGIYTYDGIGLDNFRLQDPFPNDIGVVDLITPTSGVDLDPAEVVSVLLENFGTLPQTGFNVAYKVGVGPVHTELYTGTLAPGSTDIMTFAATEDFSADGIYNVTAWTELATDEDLTNDTLNAVVVNLLPVSGTDAFYIYSNVYGGFEPWYVTTNSDAMDAVFGDGGWFLDYVEELDPLEVFDEGTCFVYLEGSDGQADELEAFLAANSDIVENWVASGGNLLLNSAPNEGDGRSFGFGGVDLIYSWYSGNVTADDPAHPIFNGPWTPITTDFTGGSFGHAKVSGGATTPVIVDSFDPSSVILSEKGWGDGHVMFGGMTPAYFHSPATEAQNLVQNIYDYLKLCAPVDLGVTALVAPEAGCGMGVETITITVENYGPSNVSTWPVKYQVDGGDIISEFADVEIAAGATGEYSFDITYDFSVPGTYELCVWTDFSGDSDESNDSLCVTIVSLATPIVDLGPNNTICDLVTLDAENTGSTYLWSTGATTQTIDVTESGTYSVTVTNPTTGCTATDEVTVTVNYTPDASFTYTATGLTLVFTNTSTDGASYSWSFGDGGTSTLASPSHTYAVGGAYTVTLTVTNPCGTDFYSVVVEVGDAVNDLVLDQAVTVTPNPTSDLTTVQIALPESMDIRLELNNSIGQQVWSAIPGNIINGTYTIDMTGLAAGVYQLQVIGEQATATKQIVLTK